ncbi:MAG: MotA/TolQ/ExbB proton channel family protein [Pirellulales bacterium]
MSRKETAPRKPSRPSLVTIVGGMGWPFLLGLAATSLFFALIYRGPLNQPVMHRYFASHPVTFVETGLFFVGLAALALKLLEVAGQLFAVGAVQLEAAPERGNAIDDCDGLLQSLDKLPGGARQSHLARRLRDALTHVKRAGSSAELNDELKYLADVDAAKQQESYALVRIVIWATPMLGFLGTVMGITEALGDLSANAKLLATSIDTAIQGLLGGLYVAFDTTALALVLSMVLMFIQFIIDRVEQQLLSTVDERANSELVGRFQGSATSTDPAVASIERVAHAMLRATEQLVQRQAQLWQQTIESAQLDWQRLYDAAGERLEATLCSALDRSLEQHSQRIDSLDETFAKPLAEQWSLVQAGLASQTAATHEQLAEIRRQGEVLSQAIQATGEVVQLERALNENLAALAGSRNFEDTVMSLSAAIHLLTTRLGKSEPAPMVELLSFEEKQSLRGKAA